MPQREKLAVEHKYKRLESCNGDDTHTNKCTRGRSRLSRGVGESTGFYSATNPFLSLGRIDATQIYMLK